MDINARINWLPGMELTAEAFSSFDENLDFRQQAAIRAALGSRIGLLPGLPFRCEGSFQHSDFRVEEFRCMALLPSGWILDSDQGFSVPVPQLTEPGYYYLCGGFSPKLTIFERRGVEFVRPVYQYEFLSAADLKCGDMIPLLRFNLHGQDFDLDPDFITPCLTIAGDERISEHIACIAELLATIEKHPNLEPGEKHRFIDHCRVSFENLYPQYAVEDLLKQTHEMVNSLEYLLFEPEGKSIKDTVPECSQYDIQLWLVWVEQLLERAQTVLDGVVLVDDSIDYDKLKAELRAEISDMLRQELHPELERMVEEQTTARVQEMEQRLTTTMQGYIDGTTRPQLHDQLFGELDEPMRKDLYRQLYDDLYRALFVPTKVEEDTFMPLI